MVGGIRAVGGFGIDAAGGDQLAHVRASALSVDGQIAIGTRSTIYGVIIHGADGHLAAIGEDQVHFAKEFQRPFDHQALAFVLSSGRRADVPGALLPATWELAHRLVEDIGLNFALLLVGGLGGVEIDDLLRPFPESG